MRSLVILTFLLFAAPAAVFAQQDAQYTQYIFNGLVINPAYAGSRESLSVLALYRYQWAGLDGAPKTLSASIHSPIGDKNALGLYIENDMVGVHNRFSAYASYAYRLQFNNNARLQLGLTAGLLSYRSDWTKIEDIQDPTDPNFSNVEDSKLLPNFGLGAYYYSDRYYIGFSVPHLLKSDLDDVSKLSKYSQHYFLSGGYVFDLSPSLRLKPSFLLKTVAASPPQADLNLNLLIKDMVWVGMGYRTGDALVFLAEYHMAKGLRIGYSYDFSVSKLSPYNNGSHEIMIGWDVARSKPEKVLSPRFF
ncbi:type IX secretion system membrane protein PorP/SprF [Sphingobacteriales bacterium UPWRP_1]|nr:hypothetical protein B6N25_13955 [Sphingobacteriales bacterium TSM_CSS]PSJ76717.1 type IX secretion system membrane protein PorP/SprF [Sphingobacteriales bacterium UPWRP_1]